MKRDSSVSITALGFIFVALILVFCFFAVSDASAQGDEVITEKHFRIDRWQVGGHDRYVPTRVYYGRQNFRYYGDFKYEGKTYTIDSFVLSRDKVSVTISPAFPPQGLAESYFTLHLGSKGRTLDQFNFGDATSSNTTKKWPGSYNTLRHGYQKTDGIIKITRFPIPDHMQFAKSRPDPTETTGRLEMVSDLNDDDETTKWRICNRGFGKEEAQVACRQLGLGTSGAEPYDLSQTDWLKITGRGIWAFVELLTIWSIGLTPAPLDNLECTGTEAKLINCKHSKLDVANACPIEKTAAVKCGN